MEKLLDALKMADDISDSLKCILKDTNKEVNPQDKEKLIELSSKIEYLLKNFHNDDVSSIYFLNKEVDTEFLKNGFSVEYNYYYAILIQDPEEVSDNKYDTSDKVPCFDICFKYHGRDIKGVYGAIAFDMIDVIASDSYKQKLGDVCGSKIIKTVDNYMMKTKYINYRVDKKFSNNSRGIML